MKLEFHFMHPQITTVYQVVSVLFMGGSSIVFESTNLKEAQKEYSKYDKMDGDPYEVISIDAVKKLKYLNFKKL